MAAKSVRKLPTPELMVTRYKSSQQKIQLRKMDRSMKQMTKLLKSPTRSPRKKLDKSGKDQLKPDDSSLKEFYPNKAKRNLSGKKVVLKPNYQSEVVGSTNKRKMATPRKGTIQSPSPSPSNTSIKVDTELMTNNSELSMTDAVRLMEMTDRLTDEDLMEILTCPSPVWWEDPPDEGYIEEPICNQSVLNKTVYNETNQDIVKDKSKDTNNKDVIDFEKELNTFKIKKVDTNVEVKKSKLESIVGNIKKKVVTNVQGSTAADGNVDDNRDAERDLDKLVNSRRFSGSTEDIYSDISFNEEEILKDLENIEIPIADDKSEDVQAKQEELPRIKVRDDLVVKPSVKYRLRNLPKTLPPKTLPPLKRKPIVKKKAKSQKAAKFTRKVKKDADSISGSNIRFISDDDSQNSDIGLNINSNDEAGEDFKNISNGLISDLAEYITVYKIMSNDLGNDTTKRTLKTGKFHQFYKKYKNNKRIMKNNFLNMDNLSSNVVTKQNQVKGCDFCLMQADSGVKNISCESCEIKGNNCKLCNFIEDTARKSSNPKCVVKNT